MIFDFIFKSWQYVFHFLMKLCMMHLFTTCIFPIIITVYTFVCCIPGTMIRLQVVIHLFSWINCTFTKISFKWVLFFVQLCVRSFEMKIEAYFGIGFLHLNHLMVLPFFEFIFFLSSHLWIYFPNHQVWFLIVK